MEVGLYEIYIVRERLELRMNRLSNHAELDYFAQVNARYDSSDNSDRFQCSFCYREKIISIWSCRTFAFDFNHFSKN
jgi:hypothetical protein